jgi:hypothetical protein
VLARGTWRDPADFRELERPGPQVFVVSRITALHEGDKIENVAVPATTEAVEHLLAEMDLE